MSLFARRTGSNFKTQRNGTVENTLYVAFNLYVFGDICTFENRAGSLELLQRFKLKVTPTTPPTHPPTAGRNIKGN